MKKKLRRDPHNSNKLTTIAGKVPNTNYCCCITNLGSL